MPRDPRLSEAEAAVDLCEQWFRGTRGGIARDLLRRVTGVEEQVDGATAWCRLNGVMWEAGVSVWEGGRLEASNDRPLAAIAKLRRLMHEQPGVLLTYDDSAHEDVRCAREIADAMEVG